MNILFLGGAKRVAMARAFKVCMPDVRIYSYELTNRVPIAIEAERIIIGKRWSDPELDSHLRQIIAELNIKAVIPFVDGAVAPAARLKDVTFVPAPCADLAEAMFNKIQCNRLLNSLHLPVPRQYPCGSSRYIAKPCHGSASKGLIEFEGECPLPDSEDYLIQEFIANRTEITTDCYVEPATGRICVCVPRERLETAGGEVTRTRTFHSARVSNLASEVLTKLQLTGAVTIQFILDNDTDRLMIMEINPRLGGGATASVAAGADIPAYILANALGKECSPAADYDDIEVVRYNTDVIFR